MEEPLVSICCLAYNHEPFIRQCIDGFLMQKTNFSIEILIHDDASTDNTADIIREYEFKYPDLIKPVYQSENQYSKGVGVTRVYQFPRARGKYIAMCEGDDYWIDPNKLQKQVDFLEANNEYGMVHTDAQVFDCRLQAIRNSNYFLFNHEDRTNSLIDKLFSCQYPIFTCTVLFRKNLALIEDYNNPFPAGDYFLWLSLATTTKFKYLNYITAVRRVLDESATHSKVFNKVYEFWLRDFEMYLFFIKKYNYTQRDVINKLYKNKVPRILDKCLRHSKQKEYRMTYKTYCKNGLKLNLRYQLFYYFSINAKLFRFILHGFDFFIYLKTGFKRKYSV